MQNPEPTKGKTGFFYGYIILGAALTMWIMCWGSQQTYGIFLKSVSADLVLNRTLVSGALTLSRITSALMGAVTGRLTDRFDPRLVFTIGGVFMGVGYCLMNQLGSTWQLYLFIGILVGIGNSVVGPSLMSTVTRWFARRRGLAIGIVSTGAGIGGAVFAPLSAWLIQDYGWRYAYLIIGIACLTLMVIAGLVIKRVPHSEGQQSQGEKTASARSVNKPGGSIAAKGISLGEAMHSPSLWIFCCILLCFGLNRGITVHIAPHVTDIGFSLTTASTIIAINSGVSIAGRLIMGQLADMIGGRRCIIIGFVLMPVAFLILLSFHEIWALYLFAILFGLSWGGLAVLRFSTASELFGTASLGAIMGIVEIFAYAGSSASPVLGGALFDSFGSYNLTFIIFAIVGAIGLVFSLLLRPSKKYMDQVTSSVSA
jgi:MFS family permease